MPVFIYKARDPKGKIVDGEISAKNIEEARRKLISQRLIPSFIKPKPTTSKLAMFARPSEQALTIFSRQLATMISAGLSLIRCLDILAEQTEDRVLKRALLEVKQDVESGKAFSAALAKHKNVFSDMYINMVRAGEIGGMLDEVLERLATFMEKDFQLKKKIKSAMTYPMVILVLAIVIVIFLVTYVLPTFIDMFKEMDVKLPWMTRVIVAFVEAVKNPYFVGMMIAILLLLGGLFFLWSSTEVGRRILDKIKLILPIFGQLNKKVAISRFARTLGTLLASGVPLMSALEIVADVSGNAVIKEAIEEVRSRLREGENLSGPLSEMDIFPPMVVQMIAVGEETGNLDSMLTKIADFYDTEVDYMLSSLTSMLEPIMIIVMGGIVGFIVIAVFMPLYQLIGKFT